MTTQLLRMMGSFIKNSPAAIAVLRGADFRFEIVNPAYAALAPGEPMLGRTVADVWPAAASLMLPTLEEVRATQAAYRANAMAIPLHHGPGSKTEERYFDFSYVPFAAPGSEPDDVRVMIIAIEVTDQRRTERELLQAHQELAAIHANAPVALFLVDQGRRGCRPGDAIGCLNSTADRRGCGHGPDCLHCAIHAAATDSLAHGAPHQNVEAWVPIMTGGVRESRCLLVSTAPMPVTGDNKVLVCAQDITDLKQAFRQLESALAEKTVLVKEVHHRVKNNLAVVSSLLRMKSEASASADARVALQESYQRVLSMAQIHEQLYESDRLDRINFSDYAEQLVQRLHRAFFGDSARVEVRTNLDPIELAIEQAVPCGLILNELLTNAFKYAFPGENQGRILVSFHQTTPGPLELAVEDNGIGIAPDLLSGRTATLGLRIVGILANQLEGSLEHQSCAGTRVVLRFRSLH
jgi:two-component sensor histidine kinase